VCEALTGTGQQEGEGKREIEGRKEEKERTNKNTRTHRKKDGEPPITYAYTRRSCTGDVARTPKQSNRKKKDRQTTQWKGKKGNTKAFKTRRYYRWGERKEVYIYLYR
jgi:hypothetical protein